VAARGGEARSLDRLRLLARLWDDLIPLPLIGRRIGLDALIGLVPGLGDVASALVASWGLVVAVRLRAPASVLGRMLLNIGLDTVIGAIPFLGDLFDIGWKAQRRNVTLLEQWLAQPDHAERRSAWVLVGVAAGLAGSLVFAIWLAVRIVGWLIGLV
jgi:hypothetical protein